MVKEIKYYDSNENELKSGFYRQEGYKYSQSLLFVEMGQKPIVIDLLQDNEKTRLASTKKEATTKITYLSRDLTPVSPNKALRLHKKELNSCKKHHLKLKKSYLKLEKSIKKYGSKLEKLTD